MKTIMTSIAAGILLAAIAMAQQAPWYNVIDLNTSLPRGWSSQATFVSNNRVVTGIAIDPAGTQHAVLWNMGLGLKVDIGTKALGGPDSGAFGINERGEAEVQAETSAPDPNNENFCGYGTGLKCLPYLWQGGVLTPLPLLGGNNGTVGQINNRGEVAGIAETGTRDPNCPSGVAVDGTGPQVLDFEAVIWGPGPGAIRKLSPLPGDSVGMAIWINDNGQAVGASGSCANTILPPIAGGPHAIIWEKDGSITDLGNLGGTVNPNAFAIANIALSINNPGQVVGASALPADSSGLSHTEHAFLWNRGTPMQDLGTLPGDVNSVAVGINDSGDVVGSSGDNGGNQRAFFWRHGAMTELNEISSGSALFLVFAFSINANGEIAGFGATTNGDIHGFLAIPAGGPSSAPGSSLPAPRQNGPIVLSEQARKSVGQKLHLARPDGR